MCYDDADLLAYLDGDLSSEETACLEEHVRACEYCRARLEKYRTVDTLLAEYVRMVTAEAERHFDPDKAWNRFLQRLHAEKSRKAWYRRFTPRRIFYAAAACLLVVGAAFGVYRWQEDRLPAPLPQVSQAPVSGTPLPTQDRLGLDSRAREQEETGKPPGTAYQAAPRTTVPSTLHGDGKAVALHEPAVGGEKHTVHRGEGAIHKPPLLPLEPGAVAAVTVYLPEHEPFPLSDEATVKEAVYLLNACAGNLPGAQPVSQQEKELAAPRLEFHLKTGKDSVRIAPLGGNKVSITLAGREFTVKAPDHLYTFFDKLATLAPGK